MRTTSNAILSKYAFFFIFLIFFFLCVKCFAGNYIVVNKYAYGSLFWGQEKHSKPEIYSLLDSNNYIPEGTSIIEVGSRYTINQSGNKIMQAIYGVDVSLVVNIVGGDVVANVTFKNNSRQSFYLYRKQLPISNEILCDDRFLITTDNIELDYVGGWCNYGSGFYEQDWLEVLPGEKYSYMVLLNKFYEFIPATHRYSIGSFEQFIINRDWVVGNHIAELMSSILILSYNCEVDGGFRYVSNVENINICKESIMDHLSNFGIYGQGPQGQIRTNEVIVEIDGRKIKSFYSK